MELVYLWVEEYKNIKKQGFNFSPRFECEFDGKNLTITKNEDYVSIFPENINVTAIVGENGSGKSSILELLTHYLRLDIPIISYKTKLSVLNKNLSEEFILIFYDDFQYRILNTTNIHVTNKFENLALSTLSFFANVDFGLNLYQHIMNKSNKFYQNNRFISNLINFIKNENHFYETTYFKPTSLYLTVSNNTENNLIKNITNQINTEYKKAENQLKHRPEELAKKNKEDIQKLSENQQLLNRLFTHIENTSLYKFDNKDNINENDMIEFIEFLNKFGLIEIYDNTKSFYHMGHNLGLSFSQLSSGEQDNIKLLLDVYNYLKIDNEITKLIFLDEPNNSSHPNWQKEFIKYLVEFIKNYSNKDTYIYMATHSPFILSDLPKENVIFLKNGKQDNPDIEQTFGANIHTLLSHGFFMENGLMGEFAKGKIEAIKKFYELVKKCEKVIKESAKVKLTIQNIYFGYEKDFKHIQSIIGEPFLKTIIKNYLDELDILFYGKNQFLDNEIKRLQSLKDD
ncbi:MAG: AAA family ATPase [Arcobacteraceae bacterium]